MQFSLLATIVVNHTALNIDSVLTEKNQPIKLRLLIKYSLKVKSIKHLWYLGYGIEICEKLTYHISVLLYYGTDCAQTLDCSQ